MGLAMSIREPTSKARSEIKAASSESDTKGFAALSKPLPQSIKVFSNPSSNRSVRLGCSSIALSGAGKSRANLVMGTCCPTNKSHKVTKQNLWKRKGAAGLGETCRQAVPAWGMRMAPHTDRNQLHNSITLSPKQGNIQPFLRIGFSPKKFCRIWHYEGTFKTKDNDVF